MINTNGMQKIVTKLIYLGVNCVCIARDVCRDFRLSFYWFRKILLKIQIDKEHINYNEYVNVWPDKVIFIDTDWACLFLSVHTLIQCQLEWNFNLPY